MITRDVTDQYPLYLPEPKAPRSKGIHVSSIIRCIATEAGILKPEWSEELSLSDARTITDPVAILRINIGLAWEEHYIPMLQGVVDHPGEMCINGVYMTHDGESVTVIITDFRLLVHEIKATYKSTNTVGELEQEFMWLCQLKAYCKGLGTRFCHMHVLFLCGDYSRPIRPKMRVWEVEFTQEEIDNNWDLLMEYKTERLRLEAEK